MKVSELKELTAPVPVSYRGLEFELEVYTEKFNDPNVRARAEASVPPLQAEPAAPDKEQTDYDAALEAYAAALKEYHDQSRERRKQQDAAFLALLIKDWRVNGQTIDGDDGAPLPVTADSVRSLGDVLPAVFFNAIKDEILRPLKPIS